MTLNGLGTQIQDCTRVRKLIERHGERFLYTVFTETEIAFCNARTHSTEYFTAFWAAKEAVFRSLGTRWRRGMNWQDVELRLKKGGEPRVKLQGNTRTLAQTRGVSQLKVTFAYSRMFATATVIAMANGKA
jgi:holo-[acyl-carrier protein] synthase